MDVDQIIPEMFENAFSYPQLDTILMVEKFIQEHSAIYKKKALWEKLPKKMRYQTYNTIIEYLVYSNKVGIDRDKKIVWIGITKGKFLKNAVPAKK